MVGRCFVEVLHHLAYVLHGSVMAFRYREEVLDLIERLNATEVGLSYVLMDDNTCPHRVEIVDVCLQSEKTAYRIAGH